MNRRLWDASIGNWYMGSLVLPSGKVATMNMNMMQVRPPHRRRGESEEAGIVCAGLWVPTCVAERLGLAGAQR